MLADKRLEPLKARETPNEKTFASSIKNSFRWSTSTSAVQNTNAHKFGRCFFSRRENAPSPRFHSVYSTLAKRYYGLDFFALKAFLKFSEAKSSEFPNAISKRPEFPTEFDHFCFSEFHNLKNVSN